MKPIKVCNLETGLETVDSLFKKSQKSTGCSGQHCVGSMMNPKAAESRLRGIDEIMEQAREFINNFYASIKRLDSPAHKSRLAEIEHQLRSSETYYLKETELIFGAKLAWRNASRCIGRIQWSKLQVFDARFTSTGQEMFEAICNHIKYATNKGSIRSAITIFPQRVKTAKNDWRIWNSQLIGYAGYRDKESGKVTGDPANVAITEVCQRLGWTGGKGGRFDVLPLVLSASGGAPEMFELPDELVMRVRLKHPRYRWFEELGLEWYAVPAVASMMLDVGGLQFTAAPFSGWYMVTEIGTRDLGDSNRYNVLEEVAQKLGLNTTSNTSLWKDRAIVELNIAVLDSFQSAGVTIVDHHTASETFMTHLANEQRLRGGCPADWVWLVPPTSGSACPVFHQEMLNYHLSPGYEYQEPVWKSFDWAAWERLKQEQREQSLALATGSGASAILGALTGSPARGAPINSPSKAGDLTPRRLRFKEIARAVKFTSKLFGKALSRRIKATILYATETGKSERFANKLAQVFSRAFNVHLMSMSDYDMTCLEHEALLLVVTSTFGNGDPPENGELFAKHLAAVKITGDTSPDIDSINSVSTNPFFQMLSEDHKDGAADSHSPSEEEEEEDDDDDEKHRTHLLELRRLSGSPASSEHSGAESPARTAKSPRAFEKSAHQNPAKQTGAPAIPKLGVPKSDSGNKLRVDVAPAARSTATRRNKRPQHGGGETNIKPLSNVRFGVFALGSTAYPHFCAFGRYVDQTLDELGAERIMRCTCGDELCGQEKAFNEWANEVFKIACEVFCLTDSIGYMDERPELVWSPADVKFVPIELVLTGTEEEPLISPALVVSTKLSEVDDNNNNMFIKPEITPTRVGSEALRSKRAVSRNLASMTNKRIVPFRLEKRNDLHQHLPEDDLQTLCVELEPDESKPPPVTFEPGDHVGVFPVNRKDMVDRILERIGRDQTVCLPERQRVQFDQVHTILVKRENMDLTPALGTTGREPDPWIAYDRLPMVSIREALTRYLDITNPPNQEFLSILARQTSDPDDKRRLVQMAKNFTIYEEWKNNKMPDLLSVLNEFNTVSFIPALITQIPAMKPRFYSISGLSFTLTLGVVRFHTSSGELRQGLCSNYLNDSPLASQPNSEPIYGYVRSAPAFHMPADETVPMILIGAGSGIAPFRSFWHRRCFNMYSTTKPDTNNKSPRNSDRFGRMELYFGCRNSNYILYKEELEQMHKCDVISGVNVAFSRPIDRDVLGQEETNQPEAGDFNTKQPRRRVYVQDKLLEHGEQVYRLIMFGGAHVYVCGDVAMAEGVYKALTQIINNNLKLSKQQISPINSTDTSTPTTTTTTTTTITAFTIEPSGTDTSPTTGGSLVSGTSSRSFEDGERYLMNMRNMNRYHEDIFGAKHS